jgi:RNA polymerase sigma-70 factor (ECF subfamily)
VDTAFEILAEQYRPMLASYARTLLYGDEHEAEDVVQETFLTAQQRLDTFRPGENFGRWLRGIARHKAQESHRVGRRRPALVDSRILEGMEGVYAIFDAPALGEESWRERIERLLRHCTEDLSQHLKNAVVRVYRDGMSLGEAAETLQASSAAVAQRLSRARKLLRLCVEQRVGNEP